MFSRMPIVCPQAGQRERGASRAARARPGERDRFTWRRRFAAQFGAMQLPLAFHHARQATDHDVEKTSDDNPEKAAKENEQARMRVDGRK